MNIPERIKELIIKHGISSINELGRISNIPQSTLATIMQGKTSPRADTINQICNGLGITMSEFFQVEDLQQRAIKISETMELSEERKAAMETFKEMSSEEQTKRLLTMYKKLKSLPPDQQKALEIIINHLSVQQ